MNRAEGRPDEPRYGEPVAMADGVVRITAPNPSPFTLHGTNTYLIGGDELAVLDPGPDLDVHFEALMAAIAGRAVTHILVSHTHRDHSPLAARLRQATGARTYAEGPHRAARALHEGETNALDAASDTDFRPDVAVADGALIEGRGWAVEAVHTPGHAANHLAFALRGTGILLTADHVMGWSTSIVAPPDGSMADYMASLDKLLARDDTLYLPGHGGPVTNPRNYVKGIKAHRKMRERAIVERIAAGDRTIPEIVGAIYRDTDPRLHGAAALSVLAHLEDLASRGGVLADGEPSLSTTYRPAQS